MDQIKKLRSLIESDGGLRPCSRKHGISHSHLSAVISGKKGIGEKLASIINTPASADLLTAAEMGTRANVTNPFLDPHLRNAFDKK